MVLTHTHLFHMYLSSPHQVPRVVLETKENETGMVLAIMQLTFSSKEDRKKKKRNKIIAGVKVTIMTINEDNLVDSDKAGGGQRR